MATASSVQLSNRISEKIYNLVQFFEIFEEYSYVHISVVSGTIFVLMQLLWRRRYGFDFDGFVHAFITGIGSILCLYLNYFASVEIRGIPENDNLKEPQAMLQCSKPLTTLHNILPAITLGYSICDILNGLTQNFPKEFLLHGICTFGFTLAYCHNNIAPVATQLLTMELSTILLTLCHVEALGPAVQGLIQGLFALMFTLARVLLAPWIYFEFFRGVYNEYQTNQGKFCFPTYMIYVTALSCAIFTSLNYYWFYKIVRKIQRKLSGDLKINDAKMD